ATSATCAVIVAGSDLDFGTFNAVQLNGGLWINGCHTIGLYAGGFATEQRSSVMAAASDAGGSPAILRPFIDALTMAPGALLVASPGLFAGSIVADADARLVGGEAGTAWNVFQSDSYTVNLLTGYRYI